MLNKLQTNKKKHVLLKYKAYKNNEYASQQTEEKNAVSAAWTTLVYFTSAFFSLFLSLKKLWNS